MAGLADLAVMVGVAMGSGRLPGRPSAAHETSTPSINCTPVVKLAQNPLSAPLKLMKGKASWRGFWANHHGGIIAITWYMYVLYFRQHRRKGTAESFFV